MKFMEGYNVAPANRTLAQAIARKLLATAPHETQRFKMLNRMIEKHSVPRYAVLWALFENSPVVALTELEAPA